MQNLIDSIILFNKSNTEFQIHYFRMGDILHLYIYDLTGDIYWHLESGYSDNNYSIKTLLIVLKELCYKLRGDDYPKEE